MDAYKKGYVYSIFVFAMWTVTSFLCHQYGKIFLAISRNYSALNDFQLYVGIDILPCRVIIPAVVLTGIQLAFCFTFVSIDNDAASGRRTARLWHALGTLSTNLSMALMATSSTFAIKMTEPVTSAIVQYFRVGTQISLLAASSLPFIVGGAIAFGGNPLAASGTAPGMVCAFLSSVFLAFRNVDLKNTSNKSNLFNVSWAQGYRSLVLRISVVVLGVGMCVYLEKLEFIPNNSTRMMVYACISATFHVIYSYVSTALVLTQVSVVSHAVVNIMKRLVVVLLLYTFGQRVATIWNFGGLMVCTAGLLEYAWGKSRQQDGSSNKCSNGITFRRIFSIVVILVTGILLISLPRVKEISPATLIDYGKLRVISQKNSTIMHGLTAFDHNGLTKLGDEILSPSADDLPDPSPEGLLEFLKRPLRDNVLNVNFVSEKLTTLNKVLKETQRLHFNIIAKEFEHAKYALLLGIADYENKGDPAITVGEIYFLARLKIQVKYYCSEGQCTEDRLKRAKTLIENYKKEEVVILCQGGGNIIGYPGIDYTRFRIIDMFSSYRIVVFSQSIWIKGWNHNHVKVASKAYSGHPNLTIVLRDPLSYSYAKKLFHGPTRLIMAPDMAFQIGHVPRSMSPLYDIMWIKRADRESPGYSVPKHIPGNIKVHISDWTLWETPSAGNSWDKAFYITTMGFFFLQRGRVVITDRLHGHILSTLMDIPHVLIDNKARKLSSYHNTWTKSVSNVVITSDPSKALGLAVELLKKYNDTLPQVAQAPDIYQDFSKVDLSVADTKLP